MPRLFARMSRLDLCFSLGSPSNVEVPDNKVRRQLFSAFYQLGDRRLPVREIVQLILRKVGPDQILSGSSGWQAVSDVWILWSQTSSTKESRCQHRHR